MLARAVFGCGHVAGDDGNPVAGCRPRDLAEGLATPRHKGRLFQEIGRRITADRKFREQHQIGPALLCPAGKFQNFRGISAEISDGRIDLREGYLHSLSLAMLRCQAGPGRGGAAQSCGRRLTPGECRGQLLLWIGCAAFDVHAFDQPISESVDMPNLAV